MQEIKDYLGTEPTRLVIYLPGKTSLPIKIGKALTQGLEGNQSGERNEGKASGLMIKAFSGLCVIGTLTNCMTQIMWHAIEGELD